MEDQGVHIVTVDIPDKYPLLRSFYRLYAENAGEKEWKAFQDQALKADISEVVILAGRVPHKFVSKAYSNLETVWNKVDGESALSWRESKELLAFRKRE